MAMLVTVDVRRRRLRGGQRRPADVRSSHKERKSSYAAAEAGLGFYLKHLRENPDVLDPVRHGAGAERDREEPDQPAVGRCTAPTRARWRKIPGVAGRVHDRAAAHRRATRVRDRPTKQSMIDMATGTFKIRVTGRATADRRAQAQRSSSTFRRESFLNFVYFTDHENLDPQAATPRPERTAQQTNCADRYRTRARRQRAASRSSSPTGDTINGPLHTNDESLLICGSPIFGREKTKDGATARTDTIEVRGAAPGYQRRNGGLRRHADDLHADRRSSRPTPSTLTLPQTNAAARGRRRRTAATSTRARRSSGSRAR